MPERRKTRLEQLADEMQAYGGRVRDDFMAGAERSAQGLGDPVERGDVLTGIPPDRPGWHRLALARLLRAALSPILSPIFQPVGEAVNTYVGKPVEDLTGCPADITDELALAGLTLGAGRVSKFGKPYLARAADEVEGLANKAGCTLGAGKPDDVDGSGPVLTRLADQADGGILAVPRKPAHFRRVRHEQDRDGRGGAGFWGRASFCRKRGGCKRISRRACT
jgi:hypothetical protein